MRRVRCAERLELAAGRTVAYCSDAGMPGINDPGFELARAARAAGAKVTVLPGASAVLLGSQEKPTPTGVFPITQKKKDHVSNIYDSPMPYMQRLTDDGITLHATTVELGYASHGCIGMPEEFARKVFEATKLGDRVYITRGKQIGMGDSLVS